MTEPAGESGKRVSWVELYLDLVFVLAVGQLAHLIVDEPERQSVWIALGLFVALWWTWIGFAVLYNRADADTQLQRALFLAGSIPAGIAAVAIAPAATGDSMVFALSMGAVRLVLAAAQQGPLRRRIVPSYLGTAALFIVSAWFPEPARYVAWGLAIAFESGAILDEDRQARREMRHGRADIASLRPDDPAEALDAHHFAERFGLFLIILLGEVLVEAGQAPVGEGATAGAWVAVGAAMTLAALLWWLYFDSAVEVNLRVLELSGGSPTIARGIFAVGHMLPSFALLITASGVGLLLEHDPPKLAYWLTSVGIGLYLLGTRVLFGATGRVPAVARIAILLATFQLARLEGELSPHGYLWLLTGWLALCVAITTRRPGDQERFLDRLLRRRLG